MIQVSNLIPPNEAADMLGIREATLATWRCTNRYGLPYIKIGRMIRYEAAELMKFINRQRITPTTTEDIFNDSNTLSN
ncbi:MAG: helix-turn-helix domain-containing protein [Chloroflexi bacterium]|nr:helix-turn-helix domain-containing protein [Chloroflexota bacterium]